jgi:4-hydroxy-2-oxoheptanedioate aldolase
MDLPVNAFKRALREGQKQIGLWASLCSGAVAEILAPAGYDWIMIDAEHAPNDLATVLEQLRALKGGTATPIVRPAWNDAVLIKRYLDLGVQSLLVPWVQNAAEAARAVAATRYPPAGIRGVALIHRASGYGRISDYLKRANDEMCVLVQVETREALGQLEAIAAVDGVDGIFIGPSDLSAAMGLLGGNRSSEMQAVFADAAARARRAGRPIGILAPVEEDARRFLDMGYSYVALGSDAGLLRVAAEQLRARFSG